MNTVADPDYDPMNGPLWQAPSLVTQSEHRKNEKDRSITVSDYRHMGRLAKQCPGRFNVCGED
jgi:hypothetical protein